jgi:nicotinamidase-related amidase
MRRGLKPRSGGSGRAAVLALDLISDFAFPDGPRVRRALSARAGAIRRLFNHARANAVPVVYANDNIGAWRSDWAELIAHCTQARRPGAELVLSLAPEAGDEILLKPRHSAFFGTPLEILLEQHRVDTLIIVGVSAESCVWMTACDAHTRGFSLVVPRDSLAGASAKGLRATMTGLDEVLKARLPSRAAGLRMVRGRII